MDRGAHDDVIWLVTCSPDGMTCVAPGLAEALGYLPEEIEGRHLDDPDLIHPDDLAETSQRLRGLVTNQAWVMRMRLRDGGWLPLQWQASRWTPEVPKLTVMTCSPRYSLPIDSTQDSS